MCLSEHKFATSVLAQYEKKMAGKRGGGGLARVSPCGHNIVNKIYTLQLLLLDLMPHVMAK
jgi:hypothetical protein